MSSEKQKQYFFNGGMIVSSANGIIEKILPIFKCASLPFNEKMPHLRIKSEMHSRHCTQTSISSQKMNMVDEEFSHKKFDECGSVNIKNADDLYSPTKINFRDNNGNTIKLRSVKEIPMPYRNIFQFPFFNVVQSFAFEKLLYSHSSVVVSAPTGSGKTVLFELALIRLLLCAQVPLHELKVVYIGPMKSLCCERVDDWRQKLSPLGLQCLELTGDSEINDFSTLHHVHVICTTPEKWDSVTRRWKDNQQLFHKICLICIDEVHVVGDAQRGATLEAVITRMKMVQTLSTGSHTLPVRFVAVSATLPNTEDIAEWLSTKLNPAVTFKLGDEYRPVKLQRVVHGYPFQEGSSDFRFDISLNYKLYSIIENYSHGRPTLVFCSSRKSCHQSAETLVKHTLGKAFPTRPQFHKELSVTASNIHDRKLAELVKGGVGVHHAGLDVNDRKLVEELFKSGKMAVLISTSTLSVGVNLPAHLVVIKATHMYFMGVATEYSDQQMLQMIGRAGRPQFDTSATVVIMTKSHLKVKYESLVNGTQVIESMLHKNLTEHLNVEIVLNTISDMADAATWLSNTLLHIRSSKNPRQYGLSSRLSVREIELALQEMCLSAINKLNSSHLVNVDTETTVMSSTESGGLMARYCLTFITMKQLSEIPSRSSIDHLISVLSGCPEFADIHLRNSDKRVLNALNKNKTQETIRYTLQGRIKTKQMKVNCLIQAGLGCLPVHDYSLSQDLMKIFRVGQRISKCLMEMQWQCVDYLMLSNSVQLCKAFKARLWPESKNVARQLDGIGPAICQALVKARYTSFKNLASADPQHLELVVNRHPPFGNKVREAATHLPRYELVVDQTRDHHDFSACLILSVSMLNVIEISDFSTCHPCHQIAVLVGDDDNNIVFKQKLFDRMLLKDPWRRTVHVNRAITGSSLYLKLFSLDWVGIDVSIEYKPVYTVLVYSHPVTKDMPNRRQAKTKHANGKNNCPATAMKPVSKMKSSSAGNVQGQISVMRDKLQSFHRTSALHSSLCSSTLINSNVIGDKFDVSSVSAISGPEKRVRDLNKVLSSKCLKMSTTPANVNGIPLKETGDMCDRNHSINMQLGPWGDLVRDFWDDDDMGEPCPKSIKTDYPHAQHFVDDTSKTSNTIATYNRVIALGNPNNNLNNTNACKQTTSYSIPTSSYSQSVKNHRDCLWGLEKRGKQTSVSNPLQYVIGLRHKFQALIDGPLDSNQFYKCRPSLTIGHIETIPSNRFPSSVCINSCSDISLEGVANCGDIGYFLDKDKPLNACFIPDSVNQGNQQLAPFSQYPNNPATKESILSTARHMNAALSRDHPHDGYGIEDSQFKPVQQHTFARSAHNKGQMLYSGQSPLHHFEACALQYQQEEQVSKVAINAQITQRKSNIAPVFGMGVLPYRNERHFNKPQWDMSKKAVMGQNYDLHEHEDAMQKGMSSNCHSLVTMSTPFGCTPATNCPAYGDCSVRWCHAKSIANIGQTRSENSQESGWEHLNLFYLNRENMSPREDTQGSSEDIFPLSHCHGNHQQSAVSSVQQITLPPWQHAQDIWQDSFTRQPKFNKILHASTGKVSRNQASLCTENLLEGIF